MDGNMSNYYTKVLLHSIGLGILTVTVCTPFLWATTVTEFPVTPSAVVPIPEPVPS